MSQDNARIRILPLVLGDEARADRTMKRMAEAKKLIAEDADLGEPRFIKESAGRPNTSLGDYDAVAISLPLGVPPHAAEIASMKKPVMMFEPHCGFHPYQAGARAALVKAGATVLPTDCPEAITASVKAMVAARKLQNSKVLLFHSNPDKHAALADTARDKLGLEIEIHPVEELKDEAKRISDAAAAATLARWKQAAFSRIVDVSNQHLTEVARLYNAEKKFIEQTGAIALGVEEFKPFLYQKLAMPNVTYALLKEEGIVCTEEADLGCLLTQLLFCIVTGEQNTMSNIYMAFRSAYEKLGPGPGYTPEMELADYRECLRDNCLVVSHFSTAGSLPKNMMVEDKWEVRETVGSWPGQSMVYSTPKMGPVTLARLDTDLANLDVYPGDGADVRKFDELGWHRCRWLVRVSSAKRFVETAISHHFAIVPGHPDLALRTLVEHLLGIGIRQY